MQILTWTATESRNCSLFAAMKRAVRASITTTGMRVFCAAKSSLRLSSSVAELSQLTAGTLTGGEKALFVTSVTGDNLTVTDVLALRGGRLQNIASAADVNQAPAEQIFLGLFPLR